MHSGENGEDGENHGHDRGESGVRGWWQKLIGKTLPCSYLLIIVVE